MKARRGFSLLEVMISASMLLVGISGLVMAAQVATQQHTHHRKMSRALLIAEQRLEAVLLLFPSSLHLSDGRHPAGGFEFFDGDGRPLPDNEGAVFRLFYECVPRGIGGSASDPLIGLTITLTVVWNENGGERTVVLRTAR